MPKKSRIIHPGYCYHVLIRGNDGDDIFLDDQDRVRFCLLLQYAIQKYPIKVHAFCLMSNHVHLIVQPETSNISSGMHSICFRYAQYFNKRYERKGFLYQDRFKSIYVQGGLYLQRLIRYIHLNPVRAGIVAHPKDYVWSSYESYSGRTNIVWLTQDLILKSFGKDELTSQQNLLKFTQTENEQANIDLSEIRQATNLGAYGEEKFILEMTGKWKDENFIIEEIVNVTCRHLNVSLSAVQSKQHGGKITKARMTMALILRHFNFKSCIGLAKKLNRTTSSIRKLAFKAENDTQTTLLAEMLYERIL